MGSRIGRSASLDDLVVGGLRKAQDAFVDRFLPDVAEGNLQMAEVVDGALFRRTGHELETLHTGRKIALRRLGLEAHEDFLLRRGHIGGDTPQELVDVAVFESRGICAEKVGRARYGRLR